MLGDPGLEIRHLPVSRSRGAPVLIGLGETDLLVGHGNRRGPDDNVDADDALVRGGFECYLDHWDPSSTLAGQDVDCSFGTIGLRDLTQGFLPIE